MIISINTVSACVIWFFLGHFTVGQNVAAVWTYERDVGSQPDFPTQIEAWFNEVVDKGFSRKSIEPFRYSRPAGHYTQVWIILLYWTQKLIVFNIYSSLRGQKLT